MKKEKTPRKPGNKTGKGGFKDNPQNIDPRVGMEAAREKALERRERKAVLFRAEEALFKNNLMNLALTGSKEDSVKRAATKDILDYIAQGNPGGILEPVKEDEWGTDEQKLKEVTNAFVTKSLECEQLKLRIEKLEKLFNKKDDE